jgi:alpha-beta hydrolase superfamily lysophospholipase
MNPTSEEIIFGAAGRRILFRSWLPRHKPDPVVVISHGYGEHGGRYTHVAMRLNEAGYAVYIPDHHGHGRSDGERGQFSMHDATDDLSRIIDLAAGRNPNCELFLLGHSMGAALALRYAMVRQERLNGLILVSPLAKVDGHDAVKTAGRLLARFAPNVPLKRIDPRLVSRDPMVCRDYAEDPLVYHHGIPASVIAQFLAHTESLPRDIGRVTIPTLLVYGTADRIVSPAGSMMIAQRITSQDLTVTPYNGLAHELLNEPEQQQVLDEICRWVAARTQVVDPYSTADAGETPATASRPRRAARTAPRAAR